MLLYIHKEKKKQLFGDSHFLKNLHKEYWRTQYDM